MRLVTSSGEIANLLGDLHLNIEDIAWSLARQRRYGGHCTAYSVAEHSVLVSRLCPSYLAFQGLMHDAHEPYTTDLPSPIKQVLDHLGDGVWTRFEALIAKKVRRHFTLPDSMSHKVKEADKKAMEHEIASLFSREGIKSWRSLGFEPDYSRPVKPLQSEEAAFQRFMQRYREVGPGI